MKRVFLFAMIVLSTVFTDGALSNEYITTKSYVDAKVALKQDEIPAAGENIENVGVGDSVVTYTATTGTIGERGIFDLDNDYDYDNHEVYEGHEDDLVPATAYAYIESLLGGIEDNLIYAYDSLYGVPVPDLGNLSQSTGVYKTCTQYIPNAAQTDANCLLWDLNNRNVFGCAANDDTCNTNGECCTNFCDNGTCACAGPSASCRKSSDCCSDVCLKMDGSDVGTCSCYSTGSSCTADVQCCGTAKCNNGTCGKVALCRTRGQSCSFLQTCCTGLTCRSGTCQ